MCSEMSTTTKILSASSIGVRFGGTKKIAGIIRDFLKINCSIDKLEKTLKGFVKKNKLSESIFEDLSNIKNLAKIKV